MLKRRILSILLVLAMLVPTAFASQPAQDNMRGVWVASVYNIDYPSNTGLSADALAAIGAHTIRMVPPLIVNEEQCDEAAKIITEAVEAVAK